MKPAPDDHPAPADPRAFQDHVLALLRQRYPDADIAPGPDPMTVQFGPFHVALHAMYCRLQGVAGDQRDAELLKLFDIISDTPATSADMPGWDEARPKIRPLLVPHNHPLAPGVIWRPFIADVAITYVLEEPDTFRYITEDLLLSWGQMPERLHEQALTNLDRLSDGGPHTQPMNPDTGVYILRYDDDLDATRLLLPSVRQDLLKTFGAVTLIAIPDRSTFIVWSPDALREDAAMGAIASMARTAAYPLSVHLFCLTEAGLVAIAPEALLASKHNVPDGVAPNSV